MDVFGFLFVLFVIGGILALLDTVDDKIFSSWDHDRWLLTVYGGKGVLVDPLASPVAEEPWEEGAGDFLSMLQQIRAQLTAEAGRADGRGR